MAKKSFSKAVKLLNKLNYSELKRDKHVIQSKLSTDELGQLIDEYEEAVDSCPHCKGESFVRWGSTKQGKQRY